MDDRELREIASTIMRVVGDLTALHGVLDVIRAASMRGCLYNDATAITHYTAQVQQRIHEAAERLTELAGRLSRLASDFARA